MAKTKRTGPVSATPTKQAKPRIAKTPNKARAPAAKKDSKTKKNTSVAKMPSRECASTN